MSWRAFGGKPDHLSSPAAGVPRCLLMPGLSPAHHKLHEARLCERQQAILNTARIETSEGRNGRRACGSHELGVGKKHSATCEAGDGLAGREARAQGARACYPNMRATLSNSLAPGAGFASKRRQNVAGCSGTREPKSGTHFSTRTIFGG